MSLARRPARCAFRCAALALASVAVALAAHGCATAPVHPPAPSTPSAAGPPAPSRQRPRAGYDQRVDELQAVDVSVLAGRRIALDPGHGGSFHGAMGVNGLTEAEVNLGVALHLRGLLEARGAIVTMTRTDDRDFLSPADSSLRADLAERVRLANDARPDLFVSIHHNADARGAHDVNETQTYYRLGDEGPSLDAAASVHRYLVRNLGIDRHRIVPGNYFVLRSAEVPAILTESSYITNPDVESRLALGAKQRLEAEALLLGIAHYFARPRPEIREFAIEAGAYGRRPRFAAAPDTLYTTEEPPRFVARIQGAFDRAELLLDGQPVPLTRADATLRSDVLVTAPGKHVAVMRAGLAGAGAARARHLRFRQEALPTSVIAQAFPNVASADVGVIGVRVRAPAAGGFAAQDTLTIRLTAGSGCLAPAETTVVMRDGAAWAYFRPVRDRRWRGDGRGVIEIRPRLERPARPIVHWSAFLSADTSGHGSGRRGLMLRAVPGDTALVNAPGTRESERVEEGDRPSHWLNRDGFAVFDLDSSGRAVVPRLPGWRPLALEPGASPPAIPLRWTAIAGGALHGRRVVLDPDGGGDDGGGTGPSGTRAANLNLEVARALAGFLEAAGAEVRLTRGGDYALSDVERVEISEAFGAERFLRIAHRAEAPLLGHYFSSAAGRRWAEGTAAALAALGLPAPRTGEDAQYPLQQTSCPALFVSAARVDDSAAEERLNAPATIRAEAYALYLALAREWATAADWRMDSLEVRDFHGRPVSGAAVTLGGGILLAADARGRVRFARTEAGPLEVEVEHPGIRVRSVLLESQSGTVLTGPRER